MGVALLGHVLMRVDSGALGRWREEVADLVVIEAKQEHDCLPLALAPHPHDLVSGDHDLGAGGEGRGRKVDTGLNRHALPERP